MVSLFQLFSYDIYLFSILYSATFFAKTLLIRELYRLVTSLDAGTPGTFYNNLIILISSILFVEFVHRQFYYISKGKINAVVTDIFKKSVINLINHKVYSIQNYDKDQLYTLNDLTHIFDRVCERVLLNCPKNIVYLLYYLYELYNFSLKAVILINTVSVISVPLLNYITMLKESNYNELYKTEVNIKGKHSERLNNIKYIKCSVSEDIEKEIADDLYDIREKLKNRDTKLTNIFVGVPEITGTVITGAIYLFGAEYIRSQLIRPLELIFLGSNSNNFVHYIIDTKSIYDDYHKHCKQMQLVFNIISNNNCLENNIDRLTNCPELYTINKINVMYKSKEAFSIESGKITTITGRNGCGKTAMIYSMLGLADIKDWNFEFDYYYNKENIKGELHYSIIRSCTGILFQGPYLFDSTVWYNVTYNIRVYNEENIYDIADLIGLKSWLLQNKHRNVGVNGEFLSGGEKKRIQLLNILLCDKQIYIFDEPTDNLDHHVKDWYVDQVLKLSRIGKLVIIITHDDNLVGKFSDININLEKP